MIGSGLTFKENCPDVRNTRVVDIVSELARFGAVPVVVDPIADAAHARHEYGIELAPLDPLPKAVAHREFQALAPDTMVKATGTGALFLDLKGIYDGKRLVAAGFAVWRL